MKEGERKRAWLLPSPPKAGCFPMAYDSQWTCILIPPSVSRHYHPFASDNTTEIAASLLAFRNFLHSRG